MTKTIIHIAGYATGERTPEDGTFLLAYDPSGNQGRGTIKTTRDKAKAKRFADAGEALDCWKQQSTTHPLRVDGRPNRPLTAFSVEFVNVED